ncbi:tRNA pseudouridine(38-40) synthase TruA [Hyunsoonleella pacifica]|uniref:tRNA pseudouridine synthase A n=1 Tax=Hyunsoonleella pacifica TaxID=1080224 RepID=A0A4Q9FKL3_9FLAO|nr:tRNA pseudouridine(38-40) synthase TruA [Hyunsoonleella pacifica]TBN13155.1 tRNA pseudouridine(38-40) synthase TruA [Hyunsoonleella pacifica]GGD28646.1 tRNA pseudouridine synthase A [Hyunsoonleella pacifica]
MRYFIELSYNGSVYHGWQIQPKATTVQEVLEDGLSKVLSDKISVMGAGRTDTGVHASQMFAHFDTDRLFDTDDLVYKLNSFLPFNIAITTIFKVKPDAHARFDATRRSYLYRVSLKKNVFTHRNAYYLKQPLDVDKMNAAAKILFEYKDFQCFSKTHTDVKTYYCNIMKAKWFLRDGEVQFTITADRFLRNMVRAIVGTMINIGLGKIAVEDLHTIIQSKNRSEAGYSVPAHGLYLTEVVYPETIKL